MIFANYQNLRNAEISWNEVYSDPGVSWIGDVINIYSSSGTLATPIQVHDNYIQGGYPGVPTATLYYSGGIVMDGRTVDNTSPDTAATATAFVKIHDNQIVGHSNYGIGLAAGHDNEAYSNRVVSSGQFADGAWYTGYGGVTVTDIPAYYQQPSVYFDNFAHDNTVGFRFEWAYPSSPNVFAPPPVRQDYVLTDCAGGASGPSSKCTDNVSLPDPINSATELSEYVRWQRKLSDSHVVIGPQDVTSLNYQGMWWAAPAGRESGWGINFAHQGDTIYATWFTFGADGKPLWLVAGVTKTATGVYSGTLYTGTGPAFNSVPFDPSKVIPAEAGTATLRFADNTNATFAYTVNGVTQSKQITREQFSSPMPTCAASDEGTAAAASNYEDIWWAAPPGSESGWGINFAHQGDTIFATWFTFGIDGQPLWLVVGANKTVPHVYTGTLYTGTGPAFNSVPFDPTKVNPTSAGTASFTFTDGNNAKFDYSVQLAGMPSTVTRSRLVTRQVFAAPRTVCN